MRESRYHPLIGSGREFVPMFRVRDEKTARQSHRLYLSENIAGYYRLCSSKEMKGAEDCGYAVHCPRCGTVMQTVALPVNNTVRALYACKNCQKEKEK